MKGPLSPESTPIVILAEGCFGAPESKTAIGVIRYGAWPISGVIDSQQAGKTIAQVLPVPNNQPIVASLQAALQLSPQPKALLIGTAPMGGDLPEAYRQIIVEAIQAGLHIISGLHIFLAEQPDLVSLAAQHNVLLWDVRTPPPENVVTRQLPRPQGTHVITMVGTDCSVGKMSAGLEVNQGLCQAGERSCFVATGQTGIMITGSGVPLDRVIGDFMAGQLEKTIDEALQVHHPKWVIVEGQGSLMHPAYSGVTMSLLHGSAPDGMILCHNPVLKTIRRFENVPLPPIEAFIPLYETAAAWIKPARVLGVCLNTAAFSEEEALDLIQQTEQATGLPTTDAVRYGVENIVKALQKQWPMQ